MRRSSGSPVGRRRPRPPSSSERACRMPFRTASTGRWWLIAPVEASATAAGSTPAAIAAAPWVFAASSRPRRPVAALAQPEFTSTTFSSASLQRSRVTRTGAAAVPESVKRAALTGFSASQTSSPTSGRPLSLSPAATPAARKPSGRPESAASSRTCDGRGHPARAEERLRLAHPRPSVSGLANITLRF